MNIMNRSQYHEKLKQLMDQNDKGFTLIELIVSIGIITLLVGFSSWAYLTVEKNSNLINQTTQLIGSVRQAQALAMSGMTQDQSNYINISIHFTANSYIIFKGSQFNPNDTDNIQADLAAGITLNTDLPSSDLTFLAKSGEVNNFDSNHNSITVLETGGLSKVLRINKLGVVNAQ